MDTPIPPFAVQAGEGIVLETPTGDTAIIKADTRQTNGSLTVIELIIGPKQGPALHTHHRDDELWVVLEGEFRFKTGGATLPASSQRQHPPGVDAVPEQPESDFPTMHLSCWFCQTCTQASPEAGSSPAGGRPPAEQAEGRRGIAVPAAP